MSNLVYPVLPGLTFDSIRAPKFNTAVQAALSTKESRMAYQQYPQMTWTLIYELLNDRTTPSDLKALFGLYMAVQGKFDTFLYVDPAFNTVSNMQFGVTDGTTLSFQTTATYQNAGGPGSPEIIQNFNGTPFFSINRYGALLEFPDSALRTQFLQQSQNFANAIWTKTNVGVVGALSSPLAPDGTATASAIQSTGTTNVGHLITQGCGAASAATGTMTLSVFLWQGAVEAQFVWLEITDPTTGSTVQAVFDRIAGTVVSTSIIGSGSWTAVPSATIAPATLAAGSNWLRIGLACAKTSANVVNATILGSSSASINTYASASSGTNIMVLWGAQYENGTERPPLSINPSNLAFPTMYIPTTTAAVTQQDIVSVGATGIVTINSANFGANAGISLNWTGSFFYRVRFDDDTLEFNQFMSNLWEAKSVKLLQIKL